MISLKRVATNPHFTQIVTRIVRKASVDTMGRNIPIEIKSKIKAIVTTPKESEVIRFAEGTNYKRFKRFISTTRFNAESVPGLPDIIIYKGNHYLVLSTDNIDEYGFTRSIAGMMETGDAKHYKD